MTATPAHCRCEGCQGPGNCGCCDSPDLDVPDDVFEEPASFATPARPDGAGDAWVDALRLWWLKQREGAPSVRDGALPPPGTVMDAFHAGYAAGATAERGRAIPLLALLDGTEQPLTAQEIQDAHDFLTRHGYLTYPYAHRLLVTLTAASAALAEQARRAEQDHRAALAEIVRPKKPLRAALAGEGGA